MSDSSEGQVNEAADDISGSEDESEVEATTSQVRVHVRMTSTLSEGGEHYDELPLPSPGLEEMGTVPGGAFSDLVIKSQIPYTAVYSSPTRMLVGLASTFLSKTKVEVKITEGKRDVTYRHPMNPNLYTIEITHGHFTWSIHKRYKHFFDLHEKLWTYRTSLKVPFPSKSHKQKRKSKHQVSKVESKIPRFPKKPEFLLSSDEIEKRKEQLEKYLNAMLQSRLYRNHDATKKFLEVSRISFIQDLGAKGKEGVVKKRSGGHKIKLDFCGACCNFGNHELFSKWRQRWLVVKDTFITYLDPNQQTIKGVLLFDSLLNVNNDSPSRRLVISNTSRSLNVKCWTDQQAITWKNSIEESKEKYSAGLADPEIRFESFAPQRTDSFAHWFVDGRSYFDALADAFEGAREEIFITDWWLSPEIYLKRPITHGDHWRLDQVLKRKADEGVKIYVQLYKEVEVAVGLDSAYTKRTLTKLHPKNIRVMRHPDLVPGETLLWAHHEKIVVIDQIIAFVGGIDLCYGRWDDQLHKLTDNAAPLVNGNEVVADGCPGENGAESSKTTMTTTGMVFGMFGNMTLGVVNQVSQEKEIVRPQPSAPSSTGQKEGNRLKRLLSRKKKENQDSVSSDDEPDSIEKKPTHRTTGFNSIDENTPLVIEKIKTTSQTAMYLSKDVSSGDAENIQDEDGKPTPPAYLSDYRAMVNMVEAAAKSRLWIGKDYNNFVLKDLTNLDDPFEDEIDRSKEPRMPWHDIACVTYGKAARDAARHFIQRWNFTKIQKAKKANHVTFLLPKTYQEEFVNIPTKLIHPEAVSANVQILRSSCEWSAGICKPDRSIQNAYLYAIDKAERFLYIENQFFISCRNDPQVHNSITDALYRRILRAHKAKKKFRVYIIMPLVPGFEGDISDQKKSQAIRTVLHWQYKSICRGAGSLLEDLDKEVGRHNTSKYVTFCGLRTHSKLNGKHITEFIYVHSKMLIADDNLVIIGSANINDRSMTGVRDSEVAMLIEDTQFVDAKMDGESVQVGKYGASLRRRCFCEHLGLLPEDYDGTAATFDPLTHPLGLEVEDVMSDHFFRDVWMKTAGINTTVYEKVFKCVPSDYILTLSQVQAYQEDALCDHDAEAAEKELAKLKGYLVLLPLQFLKDEDLTPQAMTKEAIAPTDLWT